MEIDHVIYAVDDLDAAAARFSDELGLDAGDGGVHPGWGTANRIVPLGRDYLELIAVVDEDAAAASQLGRLVLGAIEAGEGPVGWAVGTDDLDAVARRLELEIHRGARKRPDGVRLSWRTAGIDRALATSGALPFYMQWEGPEALHPGGEPHGPAGIAWVEVGEAHRDELTDWVGGAALPVRFATGVKGIVAAAVGDVVLRRGTV